MDEPTKKLAAESGPPPATASPTEALLAKLPAGAVCPVCLHPPREPLHLTRPNGCDKLDIAIVCRRHFPAMFHLLPPRVRTLVAHDLWREIDAVRGVRRPALRLPVVRGRVQGSGFRVLLDRLRLFVRLLSRRSPPAAGTRRPTARTAGRKEDPV